MPDLKEMTVEEIEAYRDELFVAKKATREALKATRAELDKRLVLEKMEAKYNSLTPAEIDFIKNKR